MSEHYAVGEVKITYGKGAATVTTPANNAVAPTVPKASYICPANSGKAAPKEERMKAFAAITVAAIGRYAATRYVNVEMTHNRKPMPNPIDAIMGAIQ